MQDPLQGRLLPVGASSSTDNGQRDKGPESIHTVNINDRKVKVGLGSTSTTLYALCRRWMRNDVPRKDQPAMQNFAKFLPKPLPLVKVENEGSSYEANDENVEEQIPFEDYIEGNVKLSSEEYLLDGHVQHFKNVRKRFREQQKQKIERYKLRLALLLQPNPYQEKFDASVHF